MKGRKYIIFTTAMILSISLFVACGNKVEETNTVIAESSTATESVSASESESESTTVQESEPTTEAVESEVVSSESEKTIDPNFNGAGHEGTLEETQQTYITYTQIDPTIMYVISNTTGERYSTYHDPNVSEGELVVSGLVDANQELLIDGKATHNGIDYYRLAFQPEMMLNHQIIIPADLVVAELQETQQQPEVQQPVDTQKPVEQQPTQQQPEVQQQTPPPASENNAPEWDASLGVSKEDWDAFFGGGNTTGQHTWQPNYGNGATMDENGNVWDPSIDEETAQKAGNLIIQ